VTGKKIPFRFYIENWLIRALRRMLRSGSPASRRNLATLAGKIIFFLVPYRKATMRANLRRAFPESTEKWRQKIIRDCYIHFTRVYFDFFPMYEAPADQFDSLVECPDVQILNEALSQKRGVVLVLFHFGNWEVCADWFARHGYKIAAVAKKMKNPLADRLFLAARTRNGLQILYKTKANSPRIWKHLRAENILYLLADQDARRNGIFVKFFGQWSSSYRGPALFALRQKAPLIAGHCLLKSNGEYSIQLKRFDTTIPAENKSESLKYLTQQITTYFEEQIRGCPEQYYWFHRRWKTQPPHALLGDR